MEHVEMEHVETCAEEDIDCSPWLDNKYRSIDGRCNNVRNARWGSTGSKFNRMAPKSRFL